MIYFISIHYDELAFIQLWKNFLPLSSHSCFIRWLAWSMQIIGCCSNGNVIFLAKIKKDVAHEWLGDHYKQKNPLTFTVGLVWSILQISPNLTTIFLLKVPAFESQNGTRMYGSLDIFFLPRFKGCLISFVSARSFFFAKSCRAKFCKQKI